MLQQTRDLECHCCLSVKYFSQLHKQFMSPFLLVQFNWYRERGGDNDKALTCGRDLVNLFFPKDVYRHSFFFFLSSSAVVLACLPTFLKRTNRKIKQCLFTAGYLGRLDRCHATRPSRTECFRRVSRLEDNGKTDKSSCIRIVTFLLKLSSQWVKYALACVYIDLPIGDMKKKKKSEHVWVHS